MWQQGSYLALVCLIGLFHRQSKFPLVLTTLSLECPSLHRGPSAPPPACRLDLPTSSYPWCPHCARVPCTLRHPQYGVSCLWGVGLSCLSPIEQLLEDRGSFLVPSGQGVHSGPTVRAASVITWGINEGQQLKPILCASSSVSSANYLRPSLPKSFATCSCFHVST